jgi:hypothetical protein
VLVSKDEGANEIMPAPMHISPAPQPRASLPRRRNGRVNGFSCRTSSDNAGEANMLCIVLLCSLCPYSARP